MTLTELKNRYDPVIVESILERMYDTPVSELVEELLFYMPTKDLDNWAEELQEDSPYSDEVNL
jgi:hypothetical protein